MKKIIIILILLILLVAFFFPIIPIRKVIYENCGINWVNCPPIKHGLTFTSLSDLLGIAPIRVK